MGKLVYFFIFDSQWENNIIKSEGYTDKWDAFENDIPVSVKNIKLNSGVDFGDFKRQTLLSQDFYLYVGFWQTDKTNIVKEYKILVSFENQIKTLFKRETNNTKYNIQTV